MVQWLRLHASSTGDVGLILLSVAKTQKEKKNLSCNAFSKINTKKNYTVSSENVSVFLQVCSYAGRQSDMN